MNARSLASALGGDAVSSYQVVCPGPGHSPKDRSLSVFIDWQAPDGFRVHPHAPGDDWQACRDHVKRQLGIGTGPRVAKGQARKVALAYATPEPPASDNTAFALAIWQEARR